MDYSLITKECAHDQGIDENLLLAVCIHESSLNPLAIRYEPHYSYLYHAREFADLNHISSETETALQMCSFGIPQIMGGVVRELGFQGPLTQLISDPALCLKFGAVKLKRFLQQYGNEMDAVSAYNQGSNRKTDGGMYQNQVYVDAVYNQLIKLREMKQ